MASLLHDSLDLASSSNLAGYNPGHIIQAVNELIPLGKTEALAAITRYYETADRQADPRQGLFWVLRLLFEVPAEPGYHPPVRLGAPRPPAPADLRTLPHFPIVLIEDIPLLMVVSYILGGLPERVDSHINFFESNGLLRTDLLRPLMTDNRIEPERIVASFASRYLIAYESNPQPGQLELIHSQLERMDQ